MNPIQKFIKLTKGEPQKIKKPQKWLITEDKFLAISEIDRLQQFCRCEKSVGLHIINFRKIRIWFMIELGLHTGLRVTEMTTIKHKDILIDQNRASIIVLGKGEKLRSVKISKKFKTVCHEYLKYKKFFGFNTSSDFYLLNSLKDNKLSKRTLQKDFKEVIKKSNLPLRYHIHNLRHTYVTYFLKASNNNFRLAQVQAGHSSIKTTQTYAGVIDKDLDKAVNNLYFKA